MKMKLTKTTTLVFALSLLISAYAVNAHADENFKTKVSWIQVREQAIQFGTEASIHKNGCGSSTSNPIYYSIPIERADSKQMLSILTAAQLSGKSIRIYLVTNECSFASPQPRVVRMRN